MSLLGAFDGLWVSNVTWRRVIRALLRPSVPDFSEIIPAGRLAGWKRNLKARVRHVLAFRATKLRSLVSRAGLRQLPKVVVGARGLPSLLATCRKALDPQQWRLASVRARELPGWARAEWGKIRSLQWSDVLARTRNLPRSSVAWWRRTSLLKRGLLASSLFLAATLTLGLLTWSGISAALDARQAYKELEAEMSHLTPVDLIQASVYHSLEGRFLEAEERSAKARSRLGFLKAFTWVPGIGGRIEEAHLLLEMGYYQARGGRNLAQAYRAGISVPLQDAPPDVAANEVARVLQGSLPQLNQAQEDLRRVGELRNRLPATERGASYGILVDRYLPVIQTVVYLSRTSPLLIGHTYALSRELSALQELAVDPLDVMEDPDEVGRVLANVTDQAAALERSIDAVRRATRAGNVGDEPELGEVSRVLDILVPGVTLLRHVTAGTRSLVTMAEAMETSGFLSQEFGEVVGAALEEARQELALAKEQVSSLQDLLSVQGINAEAFLPSVVFGGDSRCLDQHHPARRSSAGQCDQCCRLPALITGLRPTKDLSAYWPEPERNSGHGGLYRHRRRGKSGRG